MWSSPISASTPPSGEVPARLAWRSTSPERSTPGPLPYHSEKTPSYLPSPRISACCAPQMAVAARSSLRPGSNLMSARLEQRLGAGQLRIETGRAASRGSRRRSRRCDGRRGDRARAASAACAPPPARRRRRTRSLVRSYLSASVVRPRSGSGAGIARSRRADGAAEGTARRGRRGDRSCVRIRARVAIREADRRTMREARRRRIASAGVVGSRYEWSDLCSPHNLMLDD